MIVRSPSLALTTAAIACLALLGCSGGSSAHEPAQMGADGGGLLGDSGGIHDATTGPGEDGGVDATMGDADATAAEEGGQDGAADAGSGACMAGTTQCSATSNGVEMCLTTGQWGAAMGCGNQACERGGCTGVCAPSSTQCSGNGVQTCNASGAWGSAMPCTNQGVRQRSMRRSLQSLAQPSAPEPRYKRCGSDGQWSTPAPCDSNACDAGQCSGPCAAGARQCSGNGAQTCDATGMWGIPVACTSQACVSGVCAGACTPTETKCSGNGLQTCDSMGAWGSASPLSVRLCPGNVHGDVHTGYGAVHGRRGPDLRCHWLVEPRPALYEPGVCVRRVQRRLRPRFHQVLGQRRGDLRFDGQLEHAERLPVRVLRGRLHGRMRAGGTQCCENRQRRRDMRSRRGLGCGDLVQRFLRVGCVHGNVHARSDAVLGRRRADV